MAGNHHHQMILWAIVRTSTKYNHERFITIHDQEMWPLLIGRSSVAVVAIVVSATHTFFVYYLHDTAMPILSHREPLLFLFRPFFVMACNGLWSIVFWLWWDRAVWHQANPITKGTRWALVIFYDVHEKDKEEEEGSS